MTIYIKTRAQLDSFPNLINIAKELQYEPITDDFLPKFQNLLDNILKKIRYSQHNIELQNLISEILIRIFNFSASENIRRDIVNYDHMTAVDTPIYKICSTIMNISIAQSIKSNYIQIPHNTIIPVCYTSHIPHSFVMDYKLFFPNHNDVNKNANDTIYYDSICMLKYFYVHFNDIKTKSWSTNNYFDDNKVRCQDNCACIFASIKNAIFYEGKNFINKMFDVFKISPIITLCNILSINVILHFGLYAEYIELLTIATEKETDNISKILCSEYENHNSFINKKNAITFASLDIALKLFDITKSILKYESVIFTTFIVAVFFQSLDSESISTLISTHPDISRKIGKFLTRNLLNFKVTYPNIVFVIFNKGSKNICIEISQNIKKIIGHVIISIYYYLASLPKEKFDKSFLSTIFIANCENIYDDNAKIEKDDCPENLFNILTNNNTTKTSINLMDVIKHFFDSEIIYNNALQVTNNKNIRYILQFFMPTQNHLISYLKIHNIDPIILLNFFNYKITITNYIIKLYIENFVDINIYKGNNVVESHFFCLMPSNEALEKFNGELPCANNKYEINRCYRKLLVILVNYLSEPLDTKFMHSTETKRKLCYNNLIDNEVSSVLGITFDEETFYAFYTSGNIKQYIDCFTGPQYDLRKKMISCTIKKYEETVAKKGLVLDNYCLELCSLYNTKLFKYLHDKYVNTIFSVIKNNKKSFSFETEKQLRRYVMMTQNYVYMCEPCKVFKMP